MIRIISGSHKGRRIAAPKTLPTRPTTDMAKESLFNILNNQFYFDEITALDLCSGTGNISYELASRGCPNITAIDADRQCVRFINETAEKLELNSISVFQAEVMAYLKSCKQQFDLIFADPPFDYESYEELVALIWEQKLLTDEGLLVVEHISSSSLEELPHFSHSRRYGNITFSFFEE